MTSTALMVFDRAPKNTSSSGDMPMSGNEHGKVGFSFESTNAVRSVIVLSQHEGDTLFALVAKLLGQVHQLVHELGHFDGVVCVPPNRLFQHRRKGSTLYNVPLGLQSYLLVQDSFDRRAMFGFSNPEVAKRSTTPPGRIDLETS
jgi:hypothetical protein